VLTLQKLSNDFRWVGCPRVYRGFAYQNQHRILASTGRPPTRRSAMAQSPTLSVGMAGHQEAIAIASVAQAHGAEGVSRGPIGTRQCAIDTLLRHLPSQSTQRGCVDAAAPCGSWLSRYLTKPGSPCWVVTPALSSKQTGDRVTTDR